MKANKYSAKEVFNRTGKPCDSVRLTEIERRIGFVLPETYRQIVMECGGGMLREEINLIDEDSDLGYAVNVLYGNGQPSDGDDDFSLDGVCVQLMETWEIPRWGFIIGEAEGDIHTPILLNLTNPMYPPGALVCVDMESEEEVLVAESFDALWEVIQHNVEKERVIKSLPEREKIRQEYAQYVFFFDPIDDALFFPSLNVRGIPSDKLLGFVVSHDLDLDLFGVGLVGVKVSDPLAVAHNLLDDAVAAGFGIAVPKYDLVAWRGESPVPVTVNTAKWGPDKPVSPGVVRELLWRSQSVQSEFYDCPVIFTDTADSSGMTYLQAIFNRESQIWFLEFQAGAINERYWLKIDGSSYRDSGCEVVFDHVRHWIDEGLAVTAHGGWEKYDCEQDENNDDIRVIIDPETKKFLVFDLENPPK